MSLYSAEAVGDYFKSGTQLAGIRGSWIRVAAEFFALSSTV